MSLKRETIIQSLGEEKLGVGVSLALTQNLSKWGQVQKGTSKATMQKTHKQPEACRRVQNCPFVCPPNPVCMW